MNSTKYPNRDALSDANDIFLDVMRSFITHHLRRVQGEQVEDLIGCALNESQMDRFEEMLNRHDDVALAIDFNFIPQIVREHWHDVFRYEFNNDLVNQSRLWLIRHGRNRCAHIGPDLDFEFTQTYLYIIAELLGQINRLDKKEEVEDILKQLSSDHAENQLSEITKKSESLETAKNELKKKLANTERLLENSEKENLQNKGKIAELNIVEEEKKKIEKDLSNLRKDFKETEEMWQLSEKSLTTTENELEKVEKEMHSLKERVTEAEQKFEEVTKQKEDYKKRLKASEDELSTMKSDKTDAEEQITIVNNLLATISIDSTKVGSVHLALNTDSKFHIIDRRNTHKKNYLLELLTLKKPTLIYVQDDEMVNNFMKLVGPEKSEVIGQHYRYTTNTEEKEMLEALEKGELIAVVSNDAFTTLRPSHCIQHFVFCHLSPSLETFIKRCKPAFISSQTAFIHIIYNENDREKNNTWLTQKYPTYKYPKAAELREVYGDLKNQIGYKSNFVTPNKIYENYYMDEQKIETCFTIFEELGLLRRNGKGIKLLQAEKKKLEDSKVFSEGEKLKQLKQETLNSYDFQLDQSAEQIWAKITENTDITQ